MTSLVDGALDLSAKQAAGRDDIKQEDVDSACAARVHPEPHRPTSAGDRPMSSSPEMDIKLPLLSPYSRPGSAESPDSVIGRPFKRYGYADSLPGMYAAAAAAAAQMSGQVYPYGAVNGYNNAALYAAAAAASATSPISQFLQQRKRHATSDKDLLYPDTFDDSDDMSYNKRQRDSGGETKDEAYWERRRKNNEAAKRSRDMRRAKEEEIALRAACLEQENLKLRAQVAILKNDTAKLHYMLYSRV